MKFVELTKSVFPTFMRYAHPSNGDLVNSILLCFMCFLSAVGLGLALAIVL